ncbi:hypothetical protein OJJOAM_000734 [Cupriavidus sp. H18C1]
MATTLNPNLLLAIPLAPLAGAAIAGLFGTKFFGSFSSETRAGRAIAHTVTILGVAIACLLSLLVLRDVMVDGASFNATVYEWMVLPFNGHPLKMEVGFLVDSLTAMMMVVVTFVSLMVHIYTVGYMQGDPRLQPLLRLHLAVHLLDADAGDEQQLPAAVLRLGSGGPRLVSADRLLVHPSDRDLRQPEGLPGQPRRRLRLHPRHRPAAGLQRQPELHRGVRRARPAGDRDLPGHRLDDADGGMHLPVHRRDGQVGAIPAARVAAGLDGRPDPRSRR